MAIDSALGQGTTVSIYLPEAAPIRGDCSEAQSHQIPTDASHKTATILIVEDEPRTRRLARRILSEVGYQVLEAENAASATNILKRGVSVDLLFTDVVMPGELNGRDLGYWAQEHRPGLKVLLTSGRFQQASGEEATSNRILPFLKKPYSKEQLQQALQTLL